MTAIRWKPIAAQTYRIVMTRWWRIRKPIMVGVRGIVVEDGRVLLVRHTYIAGWHLPGGGVKRHETIEQAARREVLEEAGVRAADQPDAVRLLGAYTNMTEGKRDHIAVFVVEAWTRVPPTMPSLEIAEQGFYALDALPEMTTPATRRRLEEFSGKRRVNFLW